MATEYKLSYTAEQIDEKLGKIDILEEELGKVSGGNGDGLSITEKNLILGLFRNAAYVSADMNATFTQLETLWSGSGDSGGETPDEPDVPVTPTVTLTSISASYSGGSVPVGTAVTALTGIVVTAHYSDGTSEAVTGYTLYGTIAEGSNTITVSYGGKMATITVTAVAESSGGEERGVSNETEWTDGVAYTYTLIADEFVRKTGEIKEYSGWSRTPHLYCAGASQIEFTYTNSQMSDYSAFFDAYKNYISSFYPNSQNPVDVPTDAVYFVCSGPTDPVMARFGAIPRGVTQ
jgi:hypothetical protein